MDANFVHWKKWSSWSDFYFWSWRCDICSSVHAFAQCVKAAKLHTELLTDAREVLELYEPEEAKI